MTAFEDWWRPSVVRHEEAVARGEHDEQCEWRVIEVDGKAVAMYSLCHCSKRRREKAGVTIEEYGELYFPPPSCPKCDRDLDYEDGWRCHPCRVHWKDHGSDAEFTDEYGDDLAAESAAWEKAQREKHGLPV